VTTRLERAGAAHAAPGPPSRPFDPAAVRAQFPIFRTERAKPLAYLDSAATSQTVRPALEEMDRYYQTYRASIHRGIYELAS